MPKILTFVFLCGCLFALIGAAPSIGVIKSNGEFRVDGAAIRGNSTLFDGNLVETATARSVVHLAEAQITLLPESRAKVFQDHTVLEKGSGLVKDAQRHSIEAASLRIAPADKTSVLQVEVTGPSKVSVTARSGGAQVRNEQGLLVAEVLPGTPLAFDAQAGSATTMKLTGVLEFKDGVFLLTDKTANVTVELRGTDLQKYVGQNVEVTGSTAVGVQAAAGASQVVNVATITAAGKKPKPARAGISGGAKAAIVSGVAVVGTLAGLAVAGTFTGPAASAP